MPATYEPIATTTLGSAASSITFSSIPATYTDLRVVYVGTSSASNQMLIRYNGDTASNYSVTNIYGTGASAASNGNTSVTTTDWMQGTFSTTLSQMVTLDIFSYAGSTKKTILATWSGDKNATNGYVQRTVMLWRNTAAINTILLYANSGNFATGTTATLYGIKAA